MDKKSSEQLIEEYANPHSLDALLPPDTDIDFSTLAKSIGEEIMDII